MYLLVLPEEGRSESTCPALLIIPGARHIAIAISLAATNRCTKQGREIASSQGCSYAKCKAQKCRAAQLCTLGAEQHALLKLESHVVLVASKQPPHASGPHVGKRQAKQAMHACM